MAQPHRPPNILFIMDDQHRFDYLNCAGAGFVRTPNLDRLAAGGVRFTHCCTNSPVCAPARIGLATGFHPDRLGALDNQAYLPARLPTYYQRLRDHGYRVGCVGKLDLAKPDPYNGRWGDRPSVFRWGFTHPEECEGKMHAASSSTPIGPYTHYLQEQGLLADFRADYQARRAQGWTVGAAHDSVLPTAAYEDVYVGRRAAEWIQEIPDDFPWHLFVSFVGPHDPFDPPAEYADRYRSAEMPPPIAGPADDKPGWIRERQIDAEVEAIAQTRRQYCALVELIDDQVGRILEALAQRDQLDNTIVIFASDHGEMLGDHGLYQKSVMYEAALRVPLIVAGPGIEGGGVADTLVELIDLNPTICQLAGLPVLSDLDAHSFAPLLRGETDTHRVDVVSTLNNVRCIRTQRHKLIQNVNQGVELYDLAADPEELYNIAADEPKLADNLARRLRDRLLEGKWQR